MSKIFKKKKVYYPFFKQFDERRYAMISYEPFWNTLKCSNENWYTVTVKHHLSFSTLSRLKNGKDISMKTVNDLCRILNCRIQDIAEYIPSEADQKL